MTVGLAVLPETMLGISDACVGAAQAQPAAAAAPQIEKKHRQATGQVGTAPGLA